MSFSEVKSTIFTGLNILDRITNSVLQADPSDYSDKSMPPKPKLNVQNFPRPPLLERTSRHLQIKWQGKTIVDTKEAFWVLETYHPPSSSPLLEKQSFINFLLSLLSSHELPYSSTSQDK